MMSTAISDLCRLTLVSPDRIVELAVPVTVPLADLFPALLRQCGDELAERGLPEGGWVLQRLGAAPLAEDQTAASLGLSDGETLYLRPHGDQLPVADFDDLVDGVSTGVRSLPDRWRPAFTRWLFLALALATLAVAVGMLGFRSTAGAAGSRAVTAGGITVVLVTGAMVASRAIGDAAIGTVLGVGALGFAAVGGLLVGQLSTDTPGVFLNGPGLSMSGAAVAAVAGLCLVAVGGLGPVFVTAIAAGALIAFGGMLTVAASLSGPQAAAVVVTVALAMSAAAPITAFRFAGMRMPGLPTGADDLDDDIDPLPGQRLLDTTAVASTCLTALYAALGIVTTGCLALLATDSGWASMTVAAMVTVLLALRSRALVGAGQRAALLIPMVVGAACLVVDTAFRASPTVRAIVVPAGLAATAGLLTAAAVALPGRRMLPHWGRAADLVESLLAAGLIPLVLALLGVYGAMRGFGG
ncbi:type VII secretion integral membrane protein EccD [Frankia sp. CiP3]|uniref:type VII secretion integral membrane protein EccD n=2 Tax=unclassified Frankia TaxID=2632575 RepID=UPI001EF62B7C|nr:type VII secretion integral membrane protein EccD [Frankia sp. CiP3]